MSLAVFFLKNVLYGNIYISYDTIFILYAGVPERPKGEDLRSSGIGLRGFESLPLHYSVIFKIFLDSALVAQLVERHLGKVEVGGSNPP